jgi:TolB protein
MHTLPRGRFLTLTPMIFGLVALASTTAPIKGQAGRIVFDHAADEKDIWGTLDIYSVNADGTQLRALTTDGHSYSPTWSPDGRHILYIHRTYGPDNLPQSEIRPRKPEASVERDELYVMDSTGGNAHLLRRLEGPIAAPAWSPDGKTLAAEYTPYAEMAKPRVPSGPIFGLFLMPADGQGEPRLLFPNATDPAWSPDGKKLAFSVCCTTTGYAIGVGDADGTHQVRLTDPYLYTTNPYLAGADSPAWSPDGKQIAYAAAVITTAPGTPGVSNQYQIFLMGSDGSNKRQLTTGNQRCTHPTWSPDGKAIAFYCFPARARGCGDPEGFRAPGAPEPECGRRIFVMSLTDPNAKPIQITQIDGARPVFAPVP